VKLRLGSSYGEKANSLKELVNGLKTLPDSVVYYHTHHFVTQISQLATELPNDFANWIRDVLLEKVIAERVAALDIIDYATISDLKDAIIRTIEDNMDVESGRKAPQGMEFHFMAVKTFVIDTGVEARNLQEFYEGVKKVPSRSVYFHMVQSRLLLGNPTNDFSLWLSEQLHESELAERISKLDPCTWSVEGLRNKICQMVEERIYEQN